MTNEKDTIFQRNKNFSLQRVEAITLLNDKSNKKHYYCRSWKLSLKVKSQRRDATFSMGNHFILSASFTCTLTSAYRLCE